MAARKGQGLGGLVQLVRGGVTHPLRREAVRSFFSDAGVALSAAADWFSAARGQRSASWSLVFPPESGAVSEPFLYVRADFDGTVYHLGEVDRATPDFQIVGKLVSVSNGPSQAFTQDYSIERPRWSLSIEDIGGALGVHLKSRAWARSRWKVYVGFPELPASSWQPLLYEARVDGPPTVENGVVSLALIDAAEDYFGNEFPMLTLNDVKNVGSGYTQAHWRTYAPGTFAVWRQFMSPFTVVQSQGKDWTGRESEIPIPVAFGQELARVPFAWAADPAPLRIPVNGTVQGYACFAVLGASRNPYAMGRFKWADDGAPKPEIWVMQGRGSKNTVVWNGLDAHPKVIEDYYFKPFAVLSKTVWKTDPGLDLWFDVEEVVKDGVRWYVQMMYLVLNGPDSSSSLLTGAAENLLNAIREHGPAGNLYVKLPHGAESAVPSLPNGAQTVWPHSPPTVAYEIAYRYGNFARDQIDEQSFRDAQSAAELSGVVVAGGVEEKTNVAAVLRDLCATYRMDLFVGRDGLLRVRPAGVTGRDLAVDIPAAPVLTDDMDLTSFTERPLIGDERWGMANRFKLDGVKARDLARDPRLGKEYEDAGVTAALNLGRTVLRSANVSWLPSVIVGGLELRHVATAHSVQRTLVECEGPYDLLRLERGGWVYLTHWSGISATAGLGMVGQLFRVEGVEPLHATHRVKLTLVDFSDVVDNRPAVYDDRANWMRLTPGSAMPAIELVAGSEFVLPSGVAAFPADIAPGDLLIIRSPGLASNRGVRRVVDNLGASLEVVDADTGVGGQLVASETLLSGWSIMRGHTTAPTDAEKPGKYPNGSDIYLRLAGSDGLFSNGDPGYKMTGGG